MYRLKISKNGTLERMLELQPGQTYVAGRSAACEIQLDDHQQISRQHFRVIENSQGQWSVEVISKFGEINSAGQSVRELTLQVGTAFRLANYEFQMIEAEATDQAQPTQALLPAVQTQNVPVTNALVTRSVGHAPASASKKSTAAADDFDSFEKTTVARIEGVAYVRILNTKTEAVENLRLEGNLWIAGRDETCEILITDLKASRKHFELAATPDGHFITDLGSANGTSLNGKSLRPNEATSIQSGDTITVGSIQITFEIRDPNFKNKLVVIPQEILQATPQLPYSMPNAPLPYDPSYVLGAPGVPTPWTPPGPGFPPASDPKKFDIKKPKNLALVTVAVLAVLGAIFFGGGEPSSPGGGGAPNDQLDPKTVAFEKLNPVQKKMVQDTYGLARTFFMQQKWQSAGDQLRKIHDILPEGYQESWKLAQEVEELERDRQARIAIENEKRMIEINQQKVEATIRNCSPIADRTTNLAEIQNCISEALTLDPSNPRLEELRQRFQNRIQANQVEENKRREYASLVSRGQTLFNQAVSLEQSGKSLDAIKAFEKFLSSSLPDPNGLVPQARTRLQKIRDGLNQKVRRDLQEAQRLFEAGKLREAHAAVTRAAKIDPKNENVIDLNDRILRDLNQQLQEIYQNSVLEEGLGNIDAAKEKWRKIIELDRPGGEYMQRSRSKLRQYGG